MHMKHWKVVICAFLYPIPIQMQINAFSFRTPI